MATTDAANGEGIVPTSWKSALLRFDAAWQRGAVPHIQAFLLPADAVRSSDPARSLLAELIKIDLEYRWKKAPAPSGSLPARPRLEDYRAAFPALLPAGPWTTDLIAEEYRVRRRCGDRPSREEYLRRFGLGAAEASALFDAVDADMAAEEEPVSARAGTLVSTADLLQALKQSRILDARALSEVERDQGSFANAGGLVRHLLDRGGLTALQANFLLQGRAADLTVGPYLLLDRLGQGWSSHVFRARHRQLHRLVALKVIRKELIAELGPELSLRFLQEIQAMGRMAHPNVILAYDAGPIGETYFLAMEYVEGLDLARLVARDGPLPVAKACDYIRQAALGLQHAHECGLVHRDLKPPNLLLASVPGTAPRVKILDLGMARLHLTAAGKSHSCLTNDGDFMGTPDYMAPEQAEDPHHADVRADLYSLGCTLFFLLTGRPPFPGGTFLQKVNRHRDEEPPRLEMLRKDAPPAVAAIVHRLLAKGRAERFQTPLELAAALAEVAGPRLSRRWILLGGAAAGAAAVALAATSVVAWKVLKSPATPNRDNDRAKPPPSAAATNAFEFDGVRQFIAMPTDLIDAGSVLTIETWFKTGRGGILVGCQKQPWTKQGTEEGHAPRFYVGMDGLLRGGFWHGATGFTMLTGSKPVTDQRWHHAALVIEPKGLRLYQDGEQVAQVRGYVEYERLSQNQIGAGFAPGGWASGQGEPFYFQGRMREFRVWNTMLTSAGIRDAMRKPLTGKEPGLALYYVMDRVWGVTDRSRHRHDGVPGGGNEGFRPTVVEDATPP